MDVGCGQQITSPARCGVGIHLRPTCVTAVARCDAGTGWHICPAYSGTVVKSPMQINNLMSYAIAVSKCK